MLMVGWSELSGSSRGKKSVTLDDCPRTETLKASLLILGHGLAMRKNGNRIWLARCHYRPYKNCAVPELLLVKVYSV